MTSPYLLTLSAKEDAERVLPYFEALERSYPCRHARFPMRDPIADGINDKVEYARAAVFFITQNATQDALLKASIDHLVHNNTPLLAVYLDEIELPAGLQFQLALTPLFYPNRHETLASAVKTLANAPYIRNAFAQ